MQRVLVVEDDADLREIYAVSLEAFGAFQVIAVGDGSDAIESARLTRPDVIITDFSMPAMDGGELVKRLAADERTRFIPVIMVSAFADKVPHEVRLSCAAFLAKPCDPQELLRTLRAVTSTHAPP